MTFAGGFFAEEIEDRVAIMFVVQIEVSFVSRRESDKPFFFLYLFQCRCLSFRSATFGCHENSDPGKQ